MAALHAAAYRTHSLGAMEPPRTELTGIKTDFIRHQHLGETRILIESLTILPAVELATCCCGSTAAVVDVWVLLCFPQGAVLLLLCGRLHRLQVTPLPDAVLQDAGCCRAQHAREKETRRGRAQPARVAV